MSLPSSAKAKNGWKQRCTLNSPYMLHGMDREKFIFAAPISASVTEIAFSM